MAKVFEVVIIWSNIPEEVKTYVGHVSLETRHKLMSYHKQYINNTDDESMCDYFYPPNKDGELLLDYSSEFEEIKKPWQTASHSTVLTMGFIL